MANDKKKTDTQAATPAPTETERPALPPEGEKVEDNKITFSIDKELKDRLHTAKVRAEKKAMGVKFPMSNFLKACIERGIDSMDAEEAAAK